MVEADGKDGLGSKGEDVRKNVGSRVSKRHCVCTYSYNRAKCSNINVSDQMNHLHVTTYSNSRSECTASRISESS